MKINFFVLGIFFYETNQKYFAEISNHQIVSAEIIVLLYCQQSLSIMGKVGQSGPIGANQGQEEKNSVYQSTSGLRTG